MILVDHKTEEFTTQVCAVYHFLKDDPRDCKIKGSHWEESGKMGVGCPWNEKVWGDQIEGIRQGFVKGENGQFVNVRLVYPTSGE